MACDSSLAGIDIYEHIGTRQRLRTGSTRWMMKFPDTKSESEQVGLLNKFMVIKNQIHLVNKAAALHGRSSSLWFFNKILLSMVALVYAQQKAKQR
jgi:hypothetical protein